MKTLALAFVFIGNIAFGQIVTAPIYKVNTNKNARTANPNQRTQASLSLPIFEDFAVSNTLDTVLWNKNQGVTVNNTSCINPPSYNVVSFDGISADGIPYNIINPFAYGPCDSLVSNQIDLSGINASSNYNLSFYYQKGGSAEKPDTLQNDSLAIYGFASDTTWKLITSIKSTNANDTVFNLSSTALSNPKFFHDKFKIKFLSFGNQSGSWDQWHVDYIKITNSFIDDFTISSMNVSLLKNYYAIPASQFIGFENKELNDSISVKYSYIGPSFNANQPSKFVISKNNDTLQTFRKDNNDITFPYPYLSKLDYTIDKTKFSNLSDSSVINANVSIDAFIAGTEKNDSYTAKNIIHNYFAYDDGSAEWSFGINQAGGCLIQDYTLNNSDTISAVQIVWVPSITDLNGTSLKLIVLDSLKKIIYGKQVLLKNNNFNIYDSTNIYKLDSGLVLPSGKFYVGYQQNSASLLPVGFDINTPNSQHILYAVDYIKGTANFRWQNYTKSNGSLMIRPIFKRGVKTGTQRIDNEQKSELSIYPIPNNTGIFNILNDTLTGIEVFDGIGQPLDNTQYHLINSTSFYVNPAKPGIYFVNCISQNGVIRKKIVIQP